MIQLLLLCVVDDGWMDGMEDGMELELELEWNRRRYGATREPPTLRRTRALLREAASRLVRIAARVAPIVREALGAVGACLQLAREVEVAAGGRVGRVGPPRSERISHARPGELVAGECAIHQPGHVLVARVDERAVARAGEGARAAHEAAHQAAPKNLIALNNLGTIEVDLGAVDSGLARFQGAIAIRDNAASRLNAANALSLLKRDKEAIPHLAKAHEMAPGSAEILRRLGLALAASPERARSAIEAGKPHRAAKKATKKAVKKSAQGRGGLFLKSW